MHHVVGADEAQHLHNLAEGNHHNVQALGVAAEVADHEGMGRRRDLQACVGVDYYVVCSYLDDHIGRRRAEGRMERLAFLREQRLRGLHSELRTPKLLVHQNVPSIAQRAFAQRNKWQCEQRPQHQGQQEIAR